MCFKSPSWEKTGKLGCPKSPKWESEGETWSEDEIVCLPPHLENATCAMMRCTSSCCIGPLTRSLFSHGSGHAVPGNARGLVVGLLLHCVTEGRKNVSDKPL